MCIYTAVRAVQYRQWCHYWEDLVTWTQGVGGAQVTSRYPGSPSRTGHPVQDRLRSRKFCRPRTPLVTDTHPKHLAVQRVRGKPEACSLRHLMSLGAATHRPGSVECVDSLTGRVLSVGLWGVCWDVLSDWTLPLRSGCIWMDVGQHNTSAPAWPCGWGGWSGGFPQPRGGAGRRWRPTRCWARPRGWWGGHESHSGWSAWPRWPPLSPPAPAGVWPRGQKYKEKIWNLPIFLNNSKTVENSEKVVVYEKKDK